MQERAEVMAEFRAWCREQEWGPNAVGVNGQDARTTREQFRAMVEKMRELGVPVRRR